jgi:hypothetical protein
MMVMHSNAGIARVCSDNAGHVAQRGIANPPTQVHITGDAGRHEPVGERAAPKKATVLVVIAYPLVPATSQILCLFGNIRKSSFANRVVVR